MLNHSLTQVLDMMPHLPPSRSRSRSSRAALDLVGDIGKTLFGTARVKDVKLVARHVAALENKTAAFSATMAHFTDDLTSFIKVSETRFHTLKSTIQLNHQVVAQLANKLNRAQRSIEESSRMTTVMLQLFVNELYHTINLQAGLTDFMEGLHDLMRHKLSRHIIPHSDLIAIIHHINRKLLARDTQLAVMPMDTVNMYNFLPFVWTYRPSGLFITIKFPLITSSLSKFDIYKVLTFPVPINDTSNHATLLSNVPPYLGFSQDNKYFIHPTRDMLNGPILDAQTVNLPLHSLTNPSCLTSIFFDDAERIKSLCDFRVSLHYIKPAIQHLHHGNYLILNVSRIYQKCPSGRQHLPGCKFCIYTLPCFCDLATTDIYFPPRLTHCSGSNTSATHAHSVNLAMLLHIFELDEIKHISADTKFPKQPLVETPPMKLFQHNFSRLIAQDKADDLSLQRIASAMKNDKTIFQSLSDPILDSLDDMIDDSSIWSWTTILTLLNTVISVLLVLGGCYLYYRFRLLATAFAVLQTAAPTSAQNIFQPNDQAVLPLFPSTLPPPTIPPIYISIHDSTLLYALISFACALFCFTAYKFLQNSTPHAIISAEISSGKSCIFIPLLTTPYCPKFFHAQLQDNFSNIQVLGWFRPKFSWNNGSLRLTNLLDKSELSVPQQVSITIFQAVKLRIMLRKTIFCYLIAEHGFHAFHMKLCPPECIDCLAPVPANAPEAPAHTMQPSPSDPSLSISART